MASAPQAADLVQGRRVCDDLDAHVLRLHSLMHTASSVVSEPEYETLARRYSELIAGPRRLRGRLDTLMAAGSEVGLDTLIVEMERNTEALAAQEPEFVRHAEAATLCTRLAGEVANLSGHTNSYASTLTGSAQDTAHQAAAAANIDLQTAAGLAEERRWLDAAELLESRKQTLEALLASVSSHGGDVDRVTKVRELEQLCAQVKQLGTDAVTHWRVLTIDGEGPWVQYKQVLTDSGAVFSAATTAVSTWKRDINDTSHDMDAVESALLKAITNLNDFLQLATPGAST